METADEQQICLRNRKAKLVMDYIKYIRNQRKIFQKNRSKHEVEIGSDLRLIKLKYLVQIKRSEEKGNSRLVVATKKWRNHRKY